MSQRIISLCIFFAWISSAALAFEGPQEIKFNRDIKPILAESCFHCHGADPGSRKGKLRLDREEGFFKDRQDGPTVVKGNPDASPLYKRITSNDPEEVMPPPKANKTLKPEEKELIRRWIAEGAHWQPHWSFVKPERPQLPPVRNEAWARNPIDRFILAKLDAAGLQPAAEADRRTLARRLSLDLTGLPPEPEVVEAFAADNSPDAYEKLVDKFMASPRYGEHRARYWLDACRYADTHGLHFDNYREIWPYRDWVINAFNKNQPFDQFTIEQLAGDLLKNPTKEQLIATGFHRCNITTNEGGTIAEENLCNYARERVETTSWVFLGLTANCAVCHDHKFDPISQKDFYSMSAFFRNTTQGALDGNVRDTAPIIVLPKGDDEARWKALPGEINAAKKAVEDRKSAARNEFDKWLENIKPEELDAQIEKAGAPAVHLKLNDPAQTLEIKGTLDGKETTAKSKEPIQWTADGKYGKALVFSGKSPLELRADVADFERNQSFSYGCWVKVPKEFKGSAAAFARMDDTDNYRGWDLFVQDGEFATHLVHHWNDDAVKVATTGNQLKPGNWQHVMVTYDGSSKSSGFKIFVDGKETKLRTEVNTLKNSIKTTAPFLVGQRKTSMPLTNGSVQDLRIYNRVLKPDEIQRIAAQPLLKAILAKAPKDRTAKEKDELYAMFLSSDSAMNEATQRVASLETEQKRIRDRSPVAHIMEEKSGSMPVANILVRGQYDKPGDKVEANVFSALHPFPANAPRNRLGLAEWIVSPDNPITSRVIVNRFWQEIFGTGIVKTSEDFGIMGEPPTHFELLDYLAVEFRESGWDVKKFVKSIAMSATYRQSALTTPEKFEKDPANRLCSRGPRFRMDGEMIRDYALEASGLLSSTIGGPSVKPYQPNGVWEAVAMPESNTGKYKRDSGDALYRRSMYTFWKRAAPPASMDIFNAPSRETCCVRRERTDTPLQALVTLNDPQFVEAARMLAQNAMKSSNEDSGRLSYIAARVLCRPLNEKEMPVVQKSFHDLLDYYKGKQDDAKALLAVGEAKRDETLDVSQLAALTMVCNEMLNLDEALNK